MVNDGSGQAFPKPGDDERVATEGMTLRDYFAGQALAECIRLASTMHPGGAAILPWTGPAAEAAYAVAEAMLLERAKR